MYRVSLAFLVVSLLVPVAAFSAGDAIVTGSPDQGKARRLDRYGDPLPPGALARFGTLRFRPGSYVQSAALTSDGKFVATVASGERVRLIDAVSGRTVRELPTDQFGAAAVVFSPDNQQVLTVGSDGAIRLYQLVSGQLVHSFEGGVQGPLGMDGATSTFSADGRIIAVAASRSDIDGRGQTNQRGHVMVWEIATGKLLAKCDIVQNMNLGAALSPDGSTCASWGRHMPASGMMEGNGDSSPQGNTIQFWDVKTGKELRQIHLKEAAGVGALAFAPDGKSFAVAENTGSVVLMDAANGKEIRRISDEPEERAKALTRMGLPVVATFSPDGKRLAVGRDGVRIWDTATGKRLSAKDGPIASLYAIVFNREEVLACGVLINVIRIWDAMTGKVRGPADAHLFPVAAVALSAGGKTLLSIDLSTQLCSWDVASTGQMHSVEMINFRDLWSQNVSQVNVAGNGAVFSPRGKYLLFPDFKAGGIRFRDVDAGRDVSRIPLMLFGPLTGGFSGDGKRLAVAGRESEGALEMAVAAIAGQFQKDLGATLSEALERNQVVEARKTEDGTVLRRFRGLKGQTLGVAVSSTGRLVAAVMVPAPFGMSSRPGELRVWEAATGKEVAKSSLTGSAGFVGGMPVLFSPDDAAVACVQGEGVRLHEASTGQGLLLLTSERGSEPTAMSFSPDGRVLAVAYGGPRPEGEIRLWELASGSVRKKFVGHAGRITSLAFSDNGRLLASSSFDTTILTWDVSGDAGLPVAKAGFSPSEAEALWRQLNSGNAPDAYRAIRRLSSSPQDAVKLLRGKLKPVSPTSDLNELKRLANQLDSQSYSDREAAAKQLRDAGKVALPVLQDVLKHDPSPELRERAQKIVDHLSRPSLPIGDVGSTRALEVLEKINTPDARELLKALSQGRADAGQTRDAKSVLSRIGAAH